MPAPVLKAAATCVGVLCALPVSAQDGSVPVPRNGVYLHTAPSSNTVYESRDAGPTMSEVKVAACGAKVTLIAPGVPEITLDYDGQGWSGAATFNGTQVTYALTAKDETFLDLVIRIPAAGVTQGSGLTLQKADPPRGGAAIRHVGTGYLQESLFWRVVEETYVLDLYDFEVNKSDLLPDHEAVIDEALSRLLDPPADQADSCNSTLKPDVAAEVVGYASQTGPEAVNQRLAEARAAAVAARINSGVVARGATFFELSQSSIGARRKRPDETVFDAPGLETGCNRRAVWIFTLRRREIAPYSAAQAEDWLRGDLQQACGPDGDQTARAHARAKYVMARNFLDMLEAGHCTPAEEGRGQNDEMEAARLLDKANPVSTPPEGPPASGDYNTAVTRAYTLLERRLREEYATQVFDSGVHRQLEYEKMRGNPYYCWAHTLNSEASKAAIEVETSVCGTSSATVDPNEARGGAINMEAQAIDEGICPRFH